VILVDTSVWVDVLRHGDSLVAFRQQVADEQVVLSRFTALELLVGAADEAEWDRLALHLGDQRYVEMGERTWVDAARTHFELRSRGRTVGSAIDCCIAQLAIENRFVLLHRDRDFETIAEIRPLRHLRFEA